MRKFAALLITALFLAVPLAAANAVQCVPYARAASGINLSGDAWSWWANARGSYERGRAPRKGAVLVFSRQGHMRYGHLSVVSRVVNSRLVLVDHANWAPAHAADRGTVTRAVPVLDVSANNDWSEVRVWFRPARQFGNTVYRTRGFVYSPPEVKRVPDSRHVQLRQASLKSAAPARGDHARSRPSTFGLVAVGSHAFHHRHVPAGPVIAAMQQVAETDIQPPVF